MTWRKADFMVPGGSCQMNSVVNQMVARHTCSKSTKQGSRYVARSIQFNITSSQNAIPYFCNSPKVLCALLEKKIAVERRQKGPLILFQKRRLGRVAIALALVLFSPLSHCLGQVLEHTDGRLPINAGVCDADALLECRGTLGGNFLVALVDVGLNHDTNDGLFTFAQLVADNLGNLWLVAVVLVGVTCWFISLAHMRKRTRQKERRKNDAGQTYHESSPP